MSLYDRWSDADAAVLADWSEEQGFDKLTELIQAGPSKQLRWEFRNLLYFYGVELPYPNPWYAGWIPWVETDGHSYFDPDTGNTMFYTHVGGMPRGSLHEVQGRGVLPPVPRFTYTFEREMDRYK